MNKEIDFSKLIKAIEDLEAGYQDVESITDADIDAISNPHNPETHEAYLKYLEIESVLEDTKK